MTTPEPRAILCLRCNTPTGSASRSWSLAFHQWLFDGVGVCDLGAKKRPVGMYLVVFGIWYGAVRFYLDFYRIIDATYLGLTPAQYVSVVMFVAGMWGAWRLFHKSRAKERLSTEKKT